MERIEDIIKSLQNELHKKKNELLDLQIEKDYIMSAYANCDDRKRRLLQKQMEVSENKFVNLYAEVMELNYKIKKFKKLVLDN